MCLAQILAPRGRRVREVCMPMADLWAKDCSFETRLHSTSAVLLFQKGCEDYCWCAGGTADSSVSAPNICNGRFVPSLPFWARRITYFPFRVLASEVSQTKEHFAFDARTRPLPAYTLAIAVSLNSVLVLLSCLYIFPSSRHSLHAISGTTLIPDLSQPSGRSLRLLFLNEFGCTATSPKSALHTRLASVF